MSKASVAKLVNSYQIVNEENANGASIGSVGDAWYQFFFLGEAVLIGLKEPNELILKNSNDMGEKYVGLFCALEVGNFHHIVVNPKDIEDAYNLTRELGYRTKSSTSKHYPQIAINGKRYDAKLVRDVLRILGTKNLVWSQETSPYRADIIKTDIGLAAIAPMRACKEITKEGMCVEPIKVNAEIY